MRPRFSSLLAPVLAAALTAAATAPSLHAATARGGDLDTSFGTGGKVISVFPSSHTLPATTSMVPEKVLIYPDGKILVVGTVGGEKPALIRYLANGSLDTSFGTGGFVTVNIAAYHSSDPKEVSTALLLPDGKILLGGMVFYKFAVMRLNADGTQDMTFGNQSGVAEFSANNMFTENGCTALAVLGDGSILAAGSVTFPPPASASGRDFVVLRFSANGVRDNSFGPSDGRAVVDFAGRSDILESMALTTTGRIVVAGTTTASDSNANAETAIARLTSSGALDTTFSSDGKVTLVVANDKTNAADVAVLPDGKILVAGDASPENLEKSNDMMLARYDASGSLDTSFGPNGTGIVFTDFGPLSAAGGVMTDQGTGLLIQPDGKVVVTGWVRERSTDDWHYAVARHHADGMMDATFGLNGIALAPVDAYRDYGYASALQQDGKIIVAGVSRNSAGYDRVGVARLWGGTPVQTWRLKHFGSTAASGNAVDLADPDNDGRSNLLEYALGTSPVGTLQGTSTLALTVERVGIRDYATATITKPHGEEGLAYNMTVSGNLTQWFTDGLYTTVLVDDATTFKIRDNTYLTGQAPRFARIVVNWLVP